MNPILLKQSVNRWIKTSSFLKLHFADLTAEEISAVNTLLSAWKSGVLTPEIMRECSTAIDTIKASHKYHSNNRDIITNLKDFCAVATQVYAGDADTYRQFRAELAKFSVTQSEPRRQPVVQPRPVSPAANAIARSSQTAVGTAQSVNRILIKQDVVKWRDAMIYLLANRHALSQEENNAIDTLIRATRGIWTRNVAVSCDRASEVLRDSSNLHGNDRKIIEHEKTIRGLVQRHIAGAGANPSNDFIVALNEYLKTNPINVSLRPPTRNHDVNSDSRRQGGTSDTRNWWRRLDDAVRRIGFWFDDLTDTLPDLVTVIGYILIWGIAIFIVISDWVDNGFWSALLTGFLAFIITSVASAIFSYIADKIMWIILMILRLIFYNIYTLLIVVALVLAKIFWPYLNILLMQI